MERDNVREVYGRRRSSVARDEVPRVERRGGFRASVRHRRVARRGRRVRQRKERAARARPAAGSPSGAISAPDYWTFARRSAVWRWPRRTPRVFPYVRAPSTSRSTSPSYTTYPPIEGESRWCRRRCGCCASEARRCFTRGRSNRTSAASAAISSTRRTCWCRFTSAPFERRGAKKRTEHRKDRKDRTNRTRAVRRRFARGTRGRGGGREGVPAVLPRVPRRRTSRAVRAPEGLGARRSDVLRLWELVRGGDADGVSERRGGRRARRAGANERLRSHERVAAGAPKRRRRARDR